MDRAVIIGTHESFGFYFSTSLLEEGYEVTGVHYVDMDEELVEKKRMEIGRNANFQEVVQKEWLPFTEIQEQIVSMSKKHCFQRFYKKCSNASLTPASASRASRNGGRLACELEDDKHATSSKKLSFRRAKR